MRTGRRRGDSWRELPHPQGHLGHHAPSPASAASSVNPGDSHARRQERVDGKVRSKPRNATGVPAALRAGVGATGRPARLHLGQISVSPSVKWP